MTAEAAILNKSAVALAADSVVTVQYGKDVKTYHTLKLFNLCQSNSVGIMVYQNAELLSVPWETIIKEYRKHLGANTFPTLEEYAANFLAYLNGNTHLFPEAVQDEDALTSVSRSYRSIARQIDQAIKAATKNGRIGARTISRITQETVNKWHDALSNATQVDSLSAGIEGQIRKKYDDDFNKLIDQLLLPLPLTVRSRNKLRSIAVWLLTKNLQASSFALKRLNIAQPFSGVVIAGFGENDLYPAITTYTVESPVLNELRYLRVPQKSDRIDADMVARVIAFAQEDVVAGFMEGIDRDFHIRIIIQLSEVLKAYSAEVVKTIPGLRGKKKKQAWLDSLDKINQTLVKALNDAMLQYKTERHVQPICRAVSFLPKEDLALMAEALVNLTSTKRKVTLDLETVGGPIDVAVISKGDGFVWIKRKHYFDADRNPHFFSKYKR